MDWEGFGWAGKVAWWLAVSVSTLVVGLVLLWLVGRGAAQIRRVGGGLLRTVGICSVIAICLLIWRPRPG
jgi:hypothetical protein